MLTLRVRDNQGKIVKELPLGDGAYSIGRNPDNAIVLKETSLARQHAEWIIQANTCTVRDLGGGVLLNDHKIGEAQIKPGDIVVLGRLSCEISWDDGQGSKAWEDQIGQLEIIYPKEMSGTLFLEKTEMMMGRVPECDIQVMDKQSSRQHAKIALRDHIYTIEDMQSANGTWVNGKRITIHPLCIGDVIQIGALQYRFSLCAKNATEALKRTSEISQVAVIAAARKAQKKAASRRHLWLLAGACLLLLALSIACWMVLFTPYDVKKTPADTPKPVGDKHIPVVVSRLQKRSFIATFEETGSIEPGRQLLVSTKIPGSVKKLAVKEGDKVQIGQLLAALDEKTVKKELEAANSQLELAQQALDEANKLQPIVEQKMQLAQYHAKQMEAAWKSNKASEKEAIEAGQKYLDAQQANIEAKARIQRIKQEIKTFSLKIETLQDQLKDMQIVAPIAGIVSQLNINEGEMCQGPLLQIIDMDEVMAVVRISQADIGKVENGQRVRVVSSTYPDAPVYSNVGEIGKTFRVSDRTTEVKIKLENAGGKLKPGNFVNVKFLTGRKADVPSVPKEAVLQQQNNFYVYTVREIQSGDGKKFGKAVRLPVQIGYQDNKFYELNASVLQQMDEQAYVVIEGLTRLSDGARVEIVSEVQDGR